MPRWASTLSDEERTALLARFEKCETYLDREWKRFGLSCGAPIRSLLIDSFGKAKTRKLVLACKARNAPNPGPKPSPGTLRRRVVKERARRYGDDAWTLTCSGIIEVELGEMHMLQLERMNDVIRVTSARRVARTDRDVLAVGGTVLLPVAKLPNVFEAIRAVAGLKDPPTEAPKARRGGNDGGSLRRKAG